MADSPCDPKDVALAALSNLIRLMGAELVVGRHRDDLGVFEQAVRGKVGAVALDGCAPEVTETGLALATLHIERALAHIRLQAAAAETRVPQPAVPRPQPAAQILH